ncbi:hypothetical protein [Niallia sp. 01092]|uniref:hypothetical protein n=1 Tax=unclassified Niallia TaxID=2837522 RepID=UPI003FD5ABD0
MRYYLISVFAEWIGKITQTLRNWEKQNTFKPYYVIEGYCTIISQQKDDKEVDGK